MKNKAQKISVIVSTLILLSSIKILFADTVYNNKQDIDTSLFSANNDAKEVKNTNLVNLSVNHDSLLGWIADAKVLFDINSTDASAVELAAGSNVLRANGTYGYALNDKNRIKVTGEYLRENLEFDYFTGDTKQWVGQGAIGAAYEYWLGGNLFKSLQVGSHYSHAGSKDLSDKTIYLNDDTTLLDQRRIAGGDDWNGTAETAMKLWPRSLVTVGGDYDYVRYDTKYEIHDDDQGDAQGFGGHVRLQQLLSSRVQLQLQSLVSQLVNTYGGGLDWVWTQHKTTAWAVGLTSTYSNDHTTDRDFWTNGVNISIVWDQPQDDKNTVAHFTDPNINAENLTTWVATPAVRMPDVLAISDERITVTQNTTSIPFQSVTATCPAGSNVIYNASTQTFNAAGGWIQSSPAPGVANGNFNAIFSSANIMDASAGIVQCMYSVGLDEILLTNPDYQYVSPISNNWGNTPQPDWPISQQPASTCIAGASSCQFQTVDPQAMSDQASKHALINNRK